MPNDKNLETVAQTRAFGCLTRIYWMSFGNALPVFALIYIAKEKGKATWGIDVLFWLGIVSLVLFRLVDIQFCNGTTADGKPATIGHWRQYALIAFGIGLVGWGLAHGLARVL